MKIRKFISIVISSILLICLFSFSLPFDNYFSTTSFAEEKDNIDYTEGRYTVEFSNYSPTYRQTFTYNKYIDHIEIISVSHNRGMAYNTLGFLDIPEEIEGLPVTTITGLNLKSITKFTVPDSVTRIDNCTLEPWYTNYKESCPEGVIYVGKIAYGYKGDRSQIDEVVIKDGTKVLRAACFGGSIRNDIKGSSVSSIKLPSTLEIINDFAFADCDNLKEVIIPDGVKEIGEKAFQGCKSLEYVYIPDSVIKLGKEAFSGAGYYECGTENWCESLECVRLSDNITELNDKSFYGCKNLKEINLPKNLTVIGKAAFGNCDQLKSIVLHKKLTVIGKEAFQGCDQLKSIILPDSLERIESKAFAHSGLIRVSTEYKEADDNEAIFPKNLTYISGDIFSNMDSVGVETNPKIWNNIELPVNLSVDGGFTYYALSLKVYNPNCKLSGSKYNFNNNKLVVYGYIGSTAEEFAAYFKLKFIPIEPTNIKGDCNSDNSVNIADLVMLQKYILGCDRFANWKNADLCEDEYIDSFDMILLRKLLIEQVK